MEILTDNRNFDKKIEILTYNRNFDKNRNFNKKLQF